MREGGSEEWKEKNYIGFLSDKLMDVICTFYCILRIFFNDYIKF